jgi:beta-lactamase class D
MRTIRSLPLLLLLLAACSPNNVRQDKTLGRFFTDHNAKGSFALMNNATGRFTVYDLARYRDSAYMPASTFKILNALIGLQTGKIVNDSMVIPWDGVTRLRPEWNRDLTMYDAFRVSCVPYFQEVARRIGKDTMQHWLDSLKYGVQDAKSRVTITSPVDSFWLDNSLRVTPDQQLGLVKRLYFNQLPFFKSYQEMVKRAMLMENNTNYRMGYKTGSGHTPGGLPLGWVVGWIEENNHPYFFALTLELSDRLADPAGIPLKVLNGILGKLGFFKGNM